MSYIGILLSIACYLSECFIVSTKHKNKANIIIKPKLLFIVCTDNYNIILVIHSIYRYMFVCWQTYTHISYFLKIDTPYLADGTGLRSFLRMVIPIYDLYYILAMPRCIQIRDIFDKAGTKPVSIKYILVMNFIADLRIRDITGIAIKRLDMIQTSL